MMFCSNRSPSSTKQQRTTGVRLNRRIRLCNNKFGSRAFVFIEGAKDKHFRKVSIQSAARVNLVNVPLYCHMRKPSLKLEEWNEKPHEK
jgi:hypothetical protein